jgi:uncharacterized protein DUF4846
MVYKIVFYLFVSMMLLSCNNGNPIKEVPPTIIAEKTAPEKISEIEEEKKNETEPEKKLETVAETIVPELGKNTKDSLPPNLIYSFLNAENQQNLTDIINTPNGYKRISVEENSFAQWLRFLPAKPQSEKVKLYNGDLKSNQNVHFAIINIDVGNRDLQQCADAVMRLKAEYHYANKDFSKIHFNFTSGDRVAFNDWSKGKKPQISGNKVSFSPIGSSTDTSYPNFRKYMNMIYSYAGTASLSKELKSVEVENMQIGDVFIQGGFPGHAIIITDMAENENGQKVFLIAQSYMPAQDIHVLKNFNNDSLNPWYPLDFGEVLNTPEWTFYKNDLKRFR